MRLADSGTRTLCSRECGGNFWSRGKWNSRVFGFLFCGFLLSTSFSTLLASEVIPISAAKALVENPRGIQQSCTIRGTVTLAPGTFTARPGDFYVQDGTSGMLVRTNPGAHISLGDNVEVTGGVSLVSRVPGIEPKIGSAEVLLKATKVDVLGTGDILDPKFVSITDAVSGHYVGEFVHVRGNVTRLVIGDTSFGPGEVNDYLAIGDEPVLWVYTRRKRVEASWLKEVAVPGTEVEVQGILVPWDMKECRLRLRNQKDFAVVRPYPQLNVKRLLWLLAAFGFIVLGIVVWIISLKRALARRTAEIQEKETRLRHAQKMEVISQLAGGIAHDFNNILMAINGYSELLLDSGLDEEQRRHVQQIFKAGQKAAGLTRQLMAFSRGQTSYPSVLDVNWVINELRPMLVSLMGTHIHVDICLGNDRMFVMADRAQLEQVILGLAANARDAMPQGGVFSIHTEAVTVTRKTEGIVPGRYIVITIGDTGHGMDAATLSRIFEPFFTTKDIGKGSGLGLSTVYGLVRQNHGEIKAQSVVDHGSSFTVYLPYKESVPDQADLQPTLFDSTRETETLQRVEAAK